MTKTKTITPKDTNYINLLQKLQKQIDTAYSPEIASTIFYLAKSIKSNPDLKEELKNTAMHFIFNLYSYLFSHGKESLNYANEHKKLAFSEKDKVRWARIEREERQALTQIITELRNTLTQTLDFDQKQNQQFITQINIITPTPQNYNPDQLPEAKIITTHEKDEKA